MKSNARQSEIFSGWKDIATYLGRGVRTVQRYERQHALPVRRPAGKLTGAVIATKAELDSWLTATPVRSDFSQSQGVLDLRTLMKEFNERVVELHRLRAETLILRGQVTESLELLRANLRLSQLSLDQQRAKVSSIRPRPAEVLPFVAKKLP